MVKLVNPRTAVLSPPAIECLLIHPLRRKASGIVRPAAMATSTSINLLMIFSALCFLPAMSLPTYCQEPERRSWTGLHGVTSGPSDPIAPGTARPRRRRAPTAHSATTESEPHPEEPMEHFPTSAMHQRPITRSSPRSRCPPWPHGLQLGQADAAARAANSPLVCSAAAPGGLPVGLFQRERATGLQGADPAQGQPPLSERGR